MLALLSSRFSARSAIYAVLCAITATPAAAVSTLEFIWADTGTSTVTVSSAVDTVLRGDIRAVADAEGLGVIFVSFAFDTDLGNELDIATPAEIPGCALCGPGGRERTVLIGGGIRYAPQLPGYDRNQVESTGSNGGLLGSFSGGFVGGGGLVSGTTTLGSVFFRTNAANVTTDGPDVEIFVNPDGFDFVGKAPAFAADADVNYVGGSVNVPEPSAAILLAVGLAGLGLCRRRAGA